LKKFVVKCGLTYPLLSDENHIILKKLGVWGVKKMYGRQDEGIIRRTIVLDQNNVVTHTFPKVSPKGHADEVAKAIGV
jgi:peroxiredoxin Q/BCP|tara:strand:+ start:2031 stop:2264 length:234 start_codon:yes stop_codon:yes gene_type:complete